MNKKGGVKDSQTRRLNKYKRPKKTKLDIRIQKKPRKLTLKKQKIKLGKKIKQLMTKRQREVMQTAFAPSASPSPSESSSFDLEHELNKLKEHEKLPDIMDDMDRREAMDNLERSLGLSNNPTLQRQSINMPDFDIDAETKAINAATKAIIISREESNYLNYLKNQVDLGILLNDNELQLLSNLKDIVQQRKIAANSKFVTYYASSVKGTITKIEKAHAKLFKKLSAAPTTRRSTRVVVPAEAYFNRTGRILFQSFKKEEESMGRLLNGKVSKAAMDRFFEENEGVDLYN